MQNKDCDRCNRKISIVTMSSADWQRNEQRHEIREKRLYLIIGILAIALVISNVCLIINF